VDLQEARTRLERERTRLLGSIDSAESELRQESAGGEDVGELSSIDQHPADHATETFELEKDLSIVESNQEQLHDIERALARIENGTYGSCERCGRPIGEERLEAKPAARFCVEHQREAEHRT
jgi:RNA polymerase-binding protein DksA